MTNYINDSVVNLAFLDENTLLRKALASLISGANDLCVSIEVATSEELIKELLNRNSIHVLLLNVFSSLPDTFSLLEIMRTKFPDIRVVLITSSKAPSLVSRLIDAGIYGCIAKTSEPSELIFALRCAYHRKIYQNILFTEALYWNTNAKQKKQAPVKITEKHKRLLEMLWQEKSTTEISEEICLGVSSIEKMKQYLKEELGAKSVIGLLKYAINNHLISIEIAAPL